MKISLLVIVVVTLISCNSSKDNTPLGQTGEKLVTLTLEAGTLDEDLVDSYIGDITIDTTVAYNPQKLKKEFKTLIAEINKIKPKTKDLEARKKYQLAIAEAVFTRLRVINEENIPFMEECKSIYQVTPTLHPYSYYDSLLMVLDTMLGGNMMTGYVDLSDRYAEFVRPYKVDYQYVDKAFKTSIKKAAEITKEHIKLPDSEAVTIDYVERAPWSAYNWYQGNYKSLIQLNKDADIYLNRIFDIAAHESYPGHHVYYSLREEKYYREKGYVEFSIYTLFSPVSMLAEGTAEYANKLIFPDNSKIEFLRTKLDLGKLYSEGELLRYFKILNISNKLDEVIINVAKQFLDHEISPDKAIEILMHYGLQSKSSAIRKLQFINRYRSYIINYHIGKQIIAKYLEQKAGDDNNKQWEVYKNILESPYLPNDLISQEINLTSN